MFVRGKDFASFYDFLVDVGLVPTVWYFLFIIISYKIVATLEINGGEINYGLYRGTCNIRHKTQNEEKQSRKHKTENYKDKQQGPHKNWR